MLLSEATISTSPYLARRLRMLREFGESDYVRSWREYIEAVAPKPAETAGQSGPASTGAKKPVAPASNTAATTRDDDWHFACSACKTPIKVPRSATAGKRVVRVNCPKPECRKEMNMRPPRVEANLVRFACAQCQTPIAVPRGLLAAGKAAKVRCPKAECRCVMDVAAQRLR
jgi:hypothetical protein